MKLNLKYKMVLIMLLLLIFVFASIGVSNAERQMYMLEAMTNSTEDVPSCPSDSVPSCYSTVQYEDYAQYTSQGVPDLDKYILKTQVVPPVCPACPTVISDHLHGSKIDESDGSNEKNSEQQQQQSQSSEQQQEQSQSQQQEQSQSQGQSQGQQQSQSSNTNINVTTSSNYVPQSRKCTNAAKSE